jgi:preprotein translocase SecE subunit
MLYAHKPDEGRHARQTSFWLGVGMIFFGSYALSVELSGWKSLREPLFSGFPELPLLAIPLTGSFVAAALVFLACSWLYVRTLARPTVADRLIEVEGEMRKVTWPSFEEASNSSIVVIVTVLVMMGFLAFSDFLLDKVFRLLLWNRYGA